MDDSSEYDAIVIGSGFGGSMSAHALVEAGMRVLMVERGDWVPRGPQNWWEEGSLDLTPHYTRESEYRVRAGGQSKTAGMYACVGGPSVFYGAVSLRFREADFQHQAETGGGARASWPVTYEDLEPFYTRAEQMLGVAGEAGADPTDPPRSAPYPQSPPELSVVSRRIAAAAAQLGLRPFPLPLAIHYGQDAGRPACVRCATCDTFACAIGAKNDLATTVLPRLLGKGLRLLPKTVAVRLCVERSRVASVECVAKDTGERRVYRGGVVLLAAGALASAHLLLASELTGANPGGAVVGRYLMRHVCAIVYGLFPKRVQSEARFHKQVAIHDFYLGHSTVRRPSGKLGGIQQVHAPPAGLVRARLPGPIGRALTPALTHVTGLLTIAEDEPNPSNGVHVTRARTDDFGLPQLHVTYRESPRDKAASGVLVQEARRILRRAGAVLFYVHPIRTFSHALGTARMGCEPKASALDPTCRFRGVENLYVADGSVFPTSAAVNPSLTIAANALRVGEHVASVF